MSDEKPTTATREPRALGPLGTPVEATVRKLQGKVLSSHREAGTVATFAKLRRALTALPGDVPDVWRETLDVVPARLRGDEQASAAEWAAHVSVTVYALHQQGKDRAMHRRGGSLGSAARDLARATDREESIRRRFQAIAVADTDSGIVHHLRALVSLLRSENIALDYGCLADDLHTLFRRRGADSVRRRWGRDFRGYTTPTEDSETFDITTEE